MNTTIEYLFQYQKNQKQNYVMQILQIWLCTEARDVHFSPLRFSYV